MINHPDNSFKLKFGMTLSMTVLILVMVTLLGGCSFTDKDSETVKIEKQVFHPTRPLPITLTNVNWTVINQKTVDQYVRDSNTSYMSLSWEEYLTMGQNMQLILKNYKDQQSLLCYYRKELHEPECSQYEGTSK